MKIMILTSVAWMLLIIGVASLSGADSNYAKLAIALWFGTAIIGCLGLAIYF